MPNPEPHNGRIAALRERVQRRSAAHAQVAGESADAPSASPAAAALQADRTGRSDAAPAAITVAEVRLESALARVVETRAVRPARGHPELGRVGEAATPVGVRLGQMLVERQHITAAQLEAALARQSGSGHPLGEILVDLRAVSAGRLAAALAEQAGGRQTTAQLLAHLGLSPAHLRICQLRQRLTGEAITDMVRDWGLLSDEAIAKALALEHGVEFLPWCDVDQLAIASVRAAGVAVPAHQAFVPVAVAAGSGDPRPRMSIAISDMRLAGEATREFGAYQCHFHVATRDTCRVIHERFFSGSAQSVDAALARAREAGEHGTGSDADPGALRALLDALVRHARAAGASHVALDGSAAAGLIRLRVDGSWRPFRVTSREVVEAAATLVGRAGFPIPAAQAGVCETPATSGRTESRAADADVQVTAHGRGATLRIRPLNLPARDLDLLGFPPGMQQRLRGYMQTAGGMLLVCGPADSGRSTTLRGLLHCADPFTRRVGTADQAAGADIVLADDLRHPDAVQQALRHAAAGRLVLAALEVPGAPAALLRLERMAAGRAELAWALRGLATQRLVRKLCTSCRVMDERVQTDQALAGLASSGAAKLCGAPQAFRAQPPGCADCDYTGFRGRRLVAELVHCGRKIRDLLETDSRLSVLRAGVEDGSLRDNGLALVAAGVTSIDEVAAQIDLEE